ncbi:hypothetical protein [Fontibacillus phaseoli]|uniref:hypothetical protein n=1 Tax=Fontibacillus phaseoli TaxID=1416533 RepID=UPI0015F0EB3F|nr:hypothetical protein [Fontibacillus phaseoli]
MIYVHLLAMMSVSLGGPTKNLPSIVTPHPTLSKNMKENGLKPHESNLTTIRNPEPNEFHYFESMPYQ